MNNIKDSLQIKIEERDVKRISLNNKLFWERDTSNVYEELEYFTTDGTQVIHTNIMTDDNNEFLYKLKPLDVQKDQPLFGARGVDSSQIVWFNTVQNILAAIPYGNRFDIPGGASPFVGIDTTIEITRDQFKVNDYSQTPSLGEIVNPYEIVLFGLNTSGEIEERKSYVEFKKFKIVKNGIVLLDYIPVRLIKTGEIGVWDKVKGEFISRAMGNPFIAGQLLTLSMLD